MAYPDDLVAHARRLVAAADPATPDQADLRRAASSAYYALFHFLIGEACGSMFGADAAEKPLRDAFARAFDHSAMYRISLGFARGTVKAPLLAAVPPGGIAAGVRAVAGAFTLLQEERHRADYDLSNTFTAAETSDLIRKAEGAMARWPTVAADASARLYLACLLAGERVRGP